MSIVLGKGRICNFKLIHDLTAFSMCTELYCIIAKCNMYFNQN